MRAGALVVTALVLAGCRHAQQVAPPAPSAPTTVKPSGPAPPVSASPQGILARDGVLEIQRALDAKGLRVERTGVLDDATVAALATFQREHGLPETGMPGMETLRLLGVDADAIYRGRHVGGAGASAGG